ncbi:DUF3570 domain-containing protein [Shewanella sp. GXUN23E]|uniref:DUF3570 domain-containing protein n=1 Tax=Shewanella sp. GXUN23E TaxID=3422498 RepID=UPI003D7C7C59
MQLTKSKNIASALAMASCSLIGTAQAEDNKADDWKVDAAIMYYGENERVQAVEGIANVQKAFGDTSTLDMKLVVDALTGASASGAVPQGTVQTFTRPSGQGQYQVEAGKTPLDDTFHDTRVQLSGNWTEKLSPVWTVSGGLYGSKEFDYLSMGANAALERSFNKDNTTLALSGSYSHDQIDPVGGTPVALSAMVLRGNYASDDAYWQAFNATRDGNSETKDTADILLGVTQVLNANWLMQVNYGLSSVSGYMTDPYKLVSVVDSEGIALEQLYESRPDSRLKHSGYLLFKGALDSAVMDVSYRFTTDDWGISSHTLETHYRHYFNEGFYGQLHLRYYQQSEADFYTPYLQQGAPLPEFASADYRIGKMNAYTVGLKFGHRLPGGHELSYRIEYYQQNPDNPGVELLNGFNGYDLFPDVKAIVAQVSYSF